MRSPLTPDKLEIKIGGNFADYFAASILDRKEGVPRNRLKRFIQQHAQLSQRFNHHRRTSSMIVTILNLERETQTTGPPF
jgi:hypothetical protein